MKRDLIRLSENVYDMLVVGGGIYGLFAAWDATLRGLSVALVDKGDFGHATSSNSLRIIHGGLRYLQHGDIRRMRQSIRNRTVFMRIAPHLVHPLPFVIPTYGRFLRGKRALSSALRINDLISFDRNRDLDSQKHLPQGRIISREECLQLCHGIDGKGLTGGAIYYDCQMYNSERFLLSIAQSAAKSGADLANYVEVTGFLREKSRVVGVSAKDVLTDDMLDIRAKIVVNATGPWADCVLDLLGNQPSNRRSGLSKAFNLLVDRQFIPGYAVGVYGKSQFKDKDAIFSKGSRLFFITPWHNRSLIGTEHLPYNDDPDSFQITEAEIQAFLDEINAAYSAANLKRHEVCHVYGGLLPMVKNDTGHGNVQLMKHHSLHDHEKVDGVAGLLSVVGVKFTEARHVAEKAVDLVFRKLRIEPPKSLTAVTPIHGGQIKHFSKFLTEETKRKPRGLRTEPVKHLIYRYGSEYFRVLKYLNGPPEFACTVTALNRAEILYGIQEEMAQKLTDVVFRRTEIGTAGYPGETCLKTCATIMSKALKWDGAKTETELEEAKTVFR